MVRRFGQWLIRNAVLSVSLLLLIAAAWFGIQAERFRRSMKQRDAASFAEGDQVLITDAIDGDEVAVTKDDGARTVVRVLGIKSFDPTVTDLYLAQYGTICFDFLKAQFVGRRATLHLDRTKADASGRLLAYLEAETDGSTTRDLGLTLVREGLSLVYTRYDFDRMQSYLTAETEAREAQHGLWGNENASRRALALKQRWTEERLSSD
jgi:endonuclease YncB( thermonuclease family)